MLYAHIIEVRARLDNILATEQPQTIMKIEEELNDGISWMDNLDGLMTEEQKRYFNFQPDLYR